MGVWHLAMSLTAGVTGKGLMAHSLRRSQITIDPTHRLGICFAIRSSARAQNNPVQAGRALGQYALMSIQWPTTPPSIPQHRAITAPHDRDVSYAQDQHCARAFVRRISGALHRGQRRRFQMCGPAGAGDVCPGPVPTGARAGQLGGEYRADSAVQPEP